MASLVGWRDVLAASEPFSVGSVHSSGKEGCLKRLEMAKAITTNLTKQPHSSIFLGS